VVVDAVVQTARGIDRVPLGRAHRGSGTLEARLPGTVERLLGLELRLAEGEVSTAPSGTLTLGPLVASGGRPISTLRGWTLPAGGDVTHTGPRTTIAFTIEESGATLYVRPVEPTDGRSMPVVVSRDVARAAGGVGKQTVLNFEDVQVPARIVGVAARMPGVPSDSPFVLADGPWLSAAVDAGAPGEGAASEVWLAVPRDRDAVAAGLRRPPFSDL